MSAGRSTGGYTLFPNCSRKPSAERKLDSPARKPPLPPAIRPASPRHVVRNSDGSTASHRERVKLSSVHSDHSSVSGHERTCLRSSRLIPLRLSSAPDDERKSPFHLQYPTSLPEPIKPIRRKSRSTDVTSICQLPYTETEWRSIMHEVKSLYLREQYKTCSSRCKVLLDRMRGSQQNLLYHIYISAYRASSLEMMAFNLPSYSTEKQLLYYEARGSYEDAISQLEYATFSDSAPTIPDSPTRSSSARSSIDSIFSQYSKSSSIASVSPSLESCQTIRKGARTPERRQKKKVSFSLSINTSTEWSRDSEVIHNASNSPTRLLDFFPTPPSGSCSPIPPTPTLTSKPCLTKKKCSLDYDSPSLSSTQTYDTFPSTPSPTRLSHLLRYHNVLTSLCSQLTDQKESVQEIIEKSSKNQPRIKCEVISPFTGSVTERTQRLREMNFSRKRFDGLRYQKICETALSELHT